MKIGLAGKGGVGKTTIAGLLARAIAAGGREVIALDCDSNPTLGMTLGLSSEEMERLAGIRQALDRGDEAHAATVPEMLDRFGVRLPGGIHLAVVSRIDHPEPG